MVYGLIISAGRQSRFKSAVPKCLSIIDGKTLLDRNIDAMRPYCDKIYTVCSVENQNYFDKYDKIVIESGKGSGDAVWQAIERIGCYEDDLCFIMWGDALHTEDIFAKLQSNYRGRALIPCKWEKLPYVKVSQDKSHTLKVYFSKFHEDTREGFHDLSLFYCPMCALLNKLRQFRNKILRPDGTYRHKHGDEMEFMDLFNETDVEAEILECNDYEDFSFNTVEELQKLTEQKSRR